MQFTREQVERINNAKTVEELMNVSKEVGYDLTEDEAKVFIQRKSSEGLIADSDLDDIDAASQCKSCKTYSSDPPYYLIVSLLNSCPSCKTLEPGVNRCYICYYAEKKNGVCYCTARTIDNDPYR